MAMEDRSGVRCEGGRFLLFGSIFSDGVGGILEVRLLRYDIAYITSLQIKTQVRTSHNNRVRIQSAYGIKSRYRDRDKGNQRRPLLLIRRSWYR